MQRPGFLALLITSLVPLAACAADSGPKEATSIPTTPQASHTEVTVIRPDVTNTSASVASTPAVASAPPVPAPPQPAAGPCDACHGYTTNELQAALTKRATESRPCYERALTSTPGVRATMNVEVRVGRDGTACDVQATPDPPVIAGLGECVAAEYKKGNFPPPANSSCVVARVPIQFAPQQ